MDVPVSFSREDKFVVEVCAVLRGRAVTLKHVARHSCQ